MCYYNIWCLILLPLNGWPLFIRSSSRCSLAFSCSWMHSWFLACQTGSLSSGGSAEFLKLQSHASTTLSSSCLSSNWTHLLPSSNSKIIHLNEAMETYEDWLVGLTAFNGWKNICKPRTNRKHIIHKQLLNLGERGPQSISPLFYQLRYRLRYRWNPTYLLCMIQRLQSWVGTSASKTLQGKLHPP